MRGAEPPAVTVTHAEQDRVYLWDQGENIPHGPSSIVSPASATHVPVSAGLHHLPREPYVRLDRSHSAAEAVRGQRLSVGHGPRLTRSTLDSSTTFDCSTIPSSLSRGSANGACPVFAGSTGPTRRMFRSPDLVKAPVRSNQAPHRPCVLTLLAASN